MISGVVGQSPLLDTDDNRNDGLQAQKPLQMLLSCFNVTKSIEGACQTEDNTRFERSSVATSNKSAKYACLLQFTI